MTVEESIVCDGFVDMDVSIEDPEGHVKNLSPEFGTMVMDADNDEEEQFVTETVEIDNEIHRKSALIGRYRSMTEEWKERKDTQDGEAETVASPQTEISHVDDGNKDNSIFYEKHQKLFKKNSSSIFYTPLNEKESATFSKEPSLAEDTLQVESMENYFDDEEDNTSLKLACHGPHSLNSQNLIKQPPSPGESVKSNLWSCFPAIKKGSSKRSSYKMTFASPPYTPAGKDQSSRFEKAKQNLQVGCNFQGHHYSLYNDEVKVKPYFQEKIVATTENVHLVVCVHGLDGNSGDLRLVKCYLEMALPRANFDFMMSEVNQDDTFCDINEMTDKLVREILDYIDDQKIDVIRLSFVGHSLGNIIIRNAVANSKLFQYRNKLHTFLSLSGPHLGMQFHTSNLVSTGMWLMQKWKKNGSLVQLALNDSSNPRETFMYHLSLTNGFQYFKNVLLVSSVQDHYVPFHSARLEMSKQVVKDNTEGARVYKEMLDNIMNPLLIQEEINIVRYSVYHPMATSANTFIGRAAHIAMLDSELFLEKFILVTASKYFR